MNVLASARAYIRRGWSPVPIPERAKSPRIRGWPNLRLKEAEAAKYFTRPSNIGIILGEASGGLVDVDLDCRETFQFASSLLPTTGAIFGRVSPSNIIPAAGDDGSRQYLASVLLEGREGAYIKANLGVIWEIPAYTGTAFTATVTDAPKNSDVNCSVGLQEFVGATDE